MIRRGDELWGWVSNLREGGRGTRAWRVGPSESDRFTQASVSANGFLGRLPDPAGPRASTESPGLVTQEYDDPASRWHAGWFEGLFPEK
eukprot:749428-Hanusia_phi.AAC.2